MRDSLDSCFPDCWRTVGGGLRLVNEKIEYLTSKGVFYTVHVINFTLFYASSGIISFILATKRFASFWWVFRLGCSEAWPSYSTLWNGSSMV